MVGENNFIAQALVERDKTILPQLKIKLGLMKQFVKILNKEASCFDYMSRKFPLLNREKLKAHIFDWLQIKEVIKDPHFQDSMNIAVSDE